MLHGSFVSEISHEQVSLPAHRLWLHVRFDASLTLPDQCGHTNCVYISIPADISSSWFVHSWISFAVPTLNPSSTRCIWLPRSIG